MIKKYFYVKKYRKSLHKEQNNLAKTNTNITHKFMIWIQIAISKVKMDSIAKNPGQKKYLWI